MGKWAGVSAWAHQAMRRVAVVRAVAMVLHLDPDELAEEAADSMREKLQLTAEEWNEWEELKEGLEERRNRLRIVLKQRFEEWAVRPMARLLGSHCALQS